jgi:hypothetical protein
MGVAPDFACGTSPYLPPSIADASPKDPTVVRVGKKWIFVDRSDPSPDKPGYFLAIRTASDLIGVKYACLVELSRPKRSRKLIFTLTNANSARPKITPHNPRSAHLKWAKVE